MSKGGKVPHTKASIPNMSDKKYNTQEKTSTHMGDAKHNSLHSHGLKSKSSTRAPNHSQQNG